MPTNPTNQPQTPKNIQLPQETFEQLIKVCKEIKHLVDIHSLDFGYYGELEDVLEVLLDKKHKQEARQAYGGLVEARKSGSEEEGDLARLEYLKRRGVR
jgi:hypothetical protein